MVMHIRQHRVVSRYPQRRGVLLTSRVLLLWTNIVRSSLAGSVHTVVVAGFGTASEKIHGSRPREEVPSFSSQAGVPAVSGTVAYPYEM